MDHFLTLLGLSLSLYFPRYCAATDTITSRQALVGNDRIISRNGKFALGFFQTGSKSPHNTLNSYLGIWYNNVPKLTPVWVANGHSPVTDTTTPELIVSSDGNLVILNRVTTSIIWSTQTNTTSNNNTATLLNSGNLILQNSSNSSNVLWQSFDYPTDTFLPGIKLGWNKVTGLNRSLVSRKNLIDLAPGIYSEELDPSGADQYILTLLNSSIPYWSNGGFSVRSPDDWELDDRTGGCVRNTPLDCSINKSISKRDRFYPIPCVGLPNNSHSIEDATSADKCAEVCLGNCTCTGYSYGDHGCNVWFGEIINVKQQQCGDTTNTNRATLYLRVANKEVQRLESNRRRIIIGVAIAAGVAFFGLLSIFLLLMIKRIKRLSSHRTENLQVGEGIIAFRYINLQRATKNFSEKLGAGGFGAVFKGFLNDSTAIAVKRLDGVCQGEKQFRAELMGTWKKLHKRHGKCNIPEAVQSFMRTGCCNHGAPSPQ
uniref:Uncharacterized protein n=1 Tax=Avena sativa TaxID=4498 RepID=A0ACD5UAV5_AVESA